MGTKGLDMGVGVGEPAGRTVAAHAYSMQPILVSSK